MRLIKFAGLTLLLSGALSAQPRLSITGGTTFDFGELYASSAKKLLTLLNTGKDTLVITNVSASCGCTGALLSNAHIAPRDSGILAITFDAKRFSGPVEKAVSFLTNDKTQPHVTVTFRATVNKTLEFDPEYFYLSTFADSLVTKEMMVKNSSKQTITLLRITPHSGLISVMATKNAIEPGEDITLSCSGKFSEARTFSGNIEIATDHPMAPLFTIRYFALVKGNK